MAISDVTALGRSDLNPFLFADIGTEANGMTLSVVSVLARQGSDPWREASRLAALSKADAAASLAGSIASMPRSLWDPQAAAVIAARLIGLLPARPALGLASVSAPAMIRWWPGLRTAVLLVCSAMVVVSVITIIMASTPSRGIDDGGAAPSSAWVPANASK